MPTTLEAPVQAYVHCRNARCPGYDQQPVDGKRVEVTYTFGENGGDGIFTGFVERSMVTYQAADPAELACPSCGEDREVTGDPRPSYQPLSGYDPMGLLTVPRFDAGQQAPAGIGSVPSFGETDEEMEARLRAEIREEQMRERLRVEMAGD